MRQRRKTDGSGRTDYFVIVNGNAGDTIYNLKQHPEFVDFLRSNNIFLFEHERLYPRQPQREPGIPASRPEKPKPSLEAVIVQHNHSTEQLSRSQLGGYGQ
jgi:hypothetical protein